MRPAILAVSILAAMVLGACAAAMPGYVPDKGRNKLAEAAAKANPGVTGATAADGTYVPTATEQEYNCRRLTGVLQLKIQQVRDSEAHPPEGLITSLKSKSTPRPTTSGTQSVVYSEDRARLIALNNLMVTKNCGRFDLDAALKPGNTETPYPIDVPKKTAKKKDR